MKPGKSPGSDHQYNKLYKYLRKKKQFCFENVLFAGKRAE